MGCFTQRLYYFKHGSTNCFKNDCGWRQFYSSIHIFTSLPLTFWQDELWLTKYVDMWSETTVPTVFGYWSRALEAVLKPRGLKTNLNYTLLYWAMEDGLFIKKKKKREVDRNPYVKFNRWEKSIKCGIDSSCTLKHKNEKWMQCYYEGTLVWFWKRYRINQCTRSLNLYCSAKCLHCIFLK